MGDLYVWFTGVVIVTYLSYNYVAASSRKLRNVSKWNLLPPMYLQRYLPRRPNSIEVVRGAPLNWLPNRYVSRILLRFCLVRGPDIHIYSTPIIKLVFPGRPSDMERSHGRKALYVRDIYSCRAAISHRPSMQFGNSRVVAIIKKFHRDELSPAVCIKRDPSRL